MYRTRYAALPLIPHFPSSSVWKLKKIVEIPDYRDPTYRGYTEYSVINS